MAGLAEALGSAKTAYKGAASAVGNAAKSVGKAAQTAVNSAVGAAGIGNAGRIVNAAGGAAAGALGQAVGNATLGAAKKLLQGDILGAGQEVIDQITSLGGALSGPGGGAFEGYSLLGTQMRADPLMNWSWYCVLPPVASAYGFRTLGWNYVEECNVPFRQFETRSVYDQGFTKHYAGKYSVDSLRLAVYHDSQGVALNYFRAWQAAMMMPFPATSAQTSGGFFLPSINYKKNVYIYLLNPRQQVVAQIMCTGCWPTSLDSLSLVSGQSGRLIGNVTLSVDDVFLDFTGAASDLVTEAISAINSGGFDFNNPAAAGAAAGAAVAGLFNR